jgi:membrane protein
MVIFNHDRERLFFTHLTTRSYNTMRMIDQSVLMARREDVLMATFWKVVLRTFQDWWADNCLRLAASLAYYTALSLAPLVLLIVGVVGLVLDRQQVAKQLMAQIESLIGSAGRERVTSILTTSSPHEGALATPIGIFTLFIGATAVFGELQTALNLIWEVQPAPTGGVWAGLWAWLRNRIFSLALVLALAFLLLISLVISAALASAAAMFHGPERALLSRLLELAASLLVLTYVFALLYKYVPEAEIAWRDTWLGGFVTSALFTLGKRAIGFYLGQASVGSAYGAAGSMVVLLVWVYYSALTMFFGAEFIHVWAIRHGGATPEPHAISGAAPQTKYEVSTETPS